jgi:hypothetical protein
MGLRKTVYDRCVGYSGLSALISTRCYPDQVPENATYPLIVYHAPVSDDDADIRTHDGATGRTTSRVQLDCWAATGDGAEALAAQAINAWNGYSSGCAVGYAFIANTISDGWETGQREYRQIVDVIVEHAR